MNEFVVPDIYTNMADAFRFYVPEENKISELELPAVDFSSEFVLSRGVVGNIQIRGLSEYFHRKPRAIHPLHCVTTPFIGDAFVFVYRIQHGEFNR